MKRAEFLNYLKLKYSIYCLRKSFALKDMDAIYQFTKDYKGKGYYERIAMHQYPEEFKAFTKYVSQIRPKVVVEIGTKRGGSFYVWARYFKPMHLISIDLPGGIHGGGYPKQKARFFETFLSDLPSSKVSLIQADSHAQDTLERLKHLLNGAAIDFLFIDGDHRYEGVRQDFEMYSPLVRKGGYVGFHDIIASDYHHQMDCYVDRLWEELKVIFPYKEFITSASQHKYGLGVVEI
ncbi:class I SAM-dependent methyltransferase [Aestuariivivens sediminis]|uniref:class I SAM-dependent methyltransferase n=1 Tax=Aestuariivivens sediminis TaxID=2913557 RepID=UPI001F560945|nr:class I SAM-dependent methyltransferase [Aestuariivivens sediminis]